MRTGFAFAVLFLAFVSASDDDVICPDEDSGKWGGAGSYCIESNLYHCEEAGEAPVRLVEDCAGRACREAPTGYADSCEMPRHTIPALNLRCPDRKSKAWGGPGRYCIDNDLFLCDKPGGEPSMKLQICKSKCVNARSGKSDYCRGQKLPALPPQSERDNTGEAPVKAYSNPLDAYKPTANVTSSASSSSSSSTFKYGSKLGDVCGPKGAGRCGTKIAGVKYFHGYCGDSAFVCLKGTTDEALEDMMENISIGTKLLDTCGSKSQGSCNVLEKCHVGFELGFCKNGGQGPSLFCCH